MKIGSNGSQTGVLEIDGLTTGTVVLTVNNAAGSWTFTLPAVPGVQGGFICTDGSGISKWTTSFGATEYALVGPGPIAGGGVLPGLNIGLNTTTYIQVSDGTGTLIAGGGNPGFIGTRTNHDLTIRTNNIVRETVSNSGAFRWHAYGAGTLTTDASGNITTVSDERLKTKIRRFGHGLKEILGIKPILYHWKKKSGMGTNHEYPGFSAQNVRKFIPSAVSKNTEGILSLQDRGLLAAAVNAIQELNDKLLEQNEVIEKLKIELKAVKKASHGR